MPVTRAKISDFKCPPVTKRALSSSKSRPNKAQLLKQVKSLAVETSQNEDLPPMSSDGIEYPTGSEARLAYRSKQGKRVSPHQWDVYDFTLKIPAGKVARYKDICDALGSGSPRSVGSALRNNPFAPYIPCHRVIASDLFVGGYFGQWGEGQKVNRKKQLLESEGVAFDSKGYLDDENYIWTTGTAVPHS